MTDVQGASTAPCVIDVDAHIAEGPTMWEHMRGTLYERRPVMVSVPANTLYGARNAFWLIDGNIFPKPRGKGGFNLVTPSYTEHEKARTDIEIACREITDPAARMRDMDRLHVDVQVVYPTLFLTYLTGDTELEVALYKAYNRFLGEACEQTNGRIRFVAALPLRSIDDSVKQLRDARTHGAVGVFFRGIEGSRTLDDPYFFPIYEEAASLDIPICVHTGAGCPDLTNIFTIERNTGFPHVRLPALIGFRDLVGNDIPRQFPGLRFGFIEAGSAWVPFVLQQMKRFFRDDDSRWAPKLFEDNRLFVACYADEDLPYMLKFVGEDHLVIGSDYGHNDPSEEPEMVANMRARHDVSGLVIEKILGANARALYGI